MLEFFIALFGGIYYISRLTNEKAKSKSISDRSKQEFANILEEYNDWEERVVDIKLEYDMMNLPCQQKEEMRQRIQQEASVENVTDQWVMLGLLAQYAKIPKDIATSMGIYSRGVWDYAEQLRWAEERRFMLWYDSELRSHGLIEELLFARGDELFPRKTALPITDTSEVIGGRYFWAPMLIV